MTEAPLRAFLMMKSSDGTWTVTVCRDLGAIRRKWKTRREPDSEVAVLHIGFDRPPSRLFDEIALKHPGSMLLTAAAKYALPDSFVASVSPIGVAGSIEVFIGLQGWGYTLDDPTAGTEHSDTVRSSTETQEPEGWVSRFLNEHPSDAEQLSEKGVFDESSYIGGEAELERSVRHRAGLFRTHYMVGANCEDPCEYARAAPPWLAEQKLTSLRLSVRADNVFRVNDIETVRDLADWTAEALLEKQNFGRKSLSDVLQAITAALNSGPLSAVAAEAISESDGLLIEVRRFLMSLSSRERDVFVRRMGFETSPETLQEIADDYDITRERVRQIEARTIEKCIRESTWDDVLEQKISRLLIGRRFPLPVSGVEAIDGWFNGISSHQLFIKNLVQAVGKDCTHVVYIEDLYYFGRISQEVWERTLSEALTLLASGAGHGWDEVYAQSLIQGLLPETAKEYGALLWDEASRLCHFSATVDGKRTLVSYGRGAEQVVEAILSESDKPLHYTEIAKRAEFREGKRMDEKRAHSAAAKVGFLFSRGTYGLIRHLPLSDGQVSDICSEAEDVIYSESNGRQWHTTEILSEILERMDGILVSLDKYVLDIVLRKSRVLKPLGRMTWIGTKWDVDDQSRIDVHQAVLAIVQKAGRPLTTGEIRERLTAVRGVNDFFQIHPIDPLVRLQPGLWGINDRDIPFSRKEQGALLQKLLNLLTDKQSGIHSSELSNVLPLEGWTVDAFLSIASQDDRLKIAHGRYVYISEWGSPRRETIGRAVSLVLQEAAGSLALEEIAVRVSDRIGRKIDKSVISGTLQALEAQYDAINRVWTLNGTSAGQVEDQSKDLPELKVPGSDYLSH